MSSRDDLTPWAQRIRALRLERGLSQTQLAEKVGLHFTMISKIENGARQVEVGEMLRIAEALGIDPTELYR